MINNVMLSGCLSHKIDHIELRQLMIFSMDLAPVYGARPGHDSFYDGLMLPACRAIAWLSGILDDRGLK